MNQVSQYIEDVLEGTHLTGELIKLAVKRHVEDLKKDWDYYFDEEHAKKAIGLAEICRHWKGEKAGQRITLEPWQRFYLANLFGWKHKETGIRRFKESYMEVARKNGKTTLLAIISIIHLVLDKEQGSQVYCGATKEQQASILVNDAARVILNTPELNERFKLFTNREKYHRVIYEKTSSFIAPIGADSNTSDGLDPSMGNIDEYHEHKNDGVLNVVVSGMGSRRQPLLNIITTAGFNKNYPCYSVKRKTAIEVLKGVKVDESLFVMIFTLDEGDDWKDEDAWIKANPNLGVSVRIEFLREQLQKAINQGGTTEVNFKTKHLNIWTDAAEVWIQDEIYLKNNGRMSKDDLLGRECYGGLDLAKSIDLNALSLYFPEYKAYLRWFWMPEEKAKNNTDDVDYLTWAREGYIELTEGDIVDHRFIIAKVIELCTEYNIKSVAFDRFLATHGVVQGLMDEGVTLSEFGQGYVSMSTPTKEYEKLMTAGELENFENPVIRWMLGNVELAVDPAGNIKPNKGKSKNKIDGIVSDIMALGESMSGDGEISSYLEDNELETI
jgi:phage terminase large subunit-like protein